MRTTYSLKEYAVIASTYGSTSGLRHIPFEILANTVLHPPPSKAFTIWTEVSNRSVLGERVNEVALAFCSDYPGIEKASAFEQLYAIESTLEGINLANKDLHKVIAYYMRRSNMSIKQFCDHMQKIVKES